MSSALRAGLVGFAVALSLAGCGPGLYLSAVRPATRALERAREAGAEERAPYDYYFAQAHLDKAREEASESAFQDAADHARVAREYAERAEALCSETSAQP